MTVGNEPDMPLRPGASRRRRAAVFVAKIAVSAALIALVASKVDMAAVSGRIAILDPTWAVAALALLVAQLVFSAFRWWEIGRRLGMPLSHASAVRLVLIGHAFSQALPTAVGGDAVRAWLAARESGVFGRAVSSVLCDRVLALVVLLLIASASQAFLGGLAAATASMHALRLGIWSITALSIAGILVGPEVMRPFKNLRAGAILGRLLVDIRAVFGRPWILAAKVLALSVAVQLCIILGTYCIGQSLFLPLDVAACLLIIPPILVATVLPISFGGWGVREGAMVVGLGLVGIRPDGALALSVLFGIANLLAGIPGALLWLLDRSAHPRSHP